MPYTVNSAIRAFRSETVDLESTQTRTARASRDYLVRQVKVLAASDALFPRLAGDPVHYGSFARRTKVRPLDDIDSMVVLDGTGTSEQSAWGQGISVRIDRSTAPLATFDDGGGFVSSVRVLNRMKAELSGLPSYQKAEVRRNQQAVVLNLTSYPWSFDLVPAVGVEGFWSGQTDYYLIPDGSGHWMRTDPREDQERATRINGQHAGLFLPTVRLVKRWNTHGAHVKPTLGSYYVETLAGHVFDGAYAIESVQDGVSQFFSGAGLHLQSSCPDPKGLGPDLDADVSWDTKQKVSAALGEASERLKYARFYEGEGDNASAIYWWGRVFGSSFPSYG